MTSRYPTAADVLAVGRVATGKDIEVRDAGLLLSALQRPQQTVFGADAYVGPWATAAALLHSFTRNRALVDGNERTGLALAWSFLVVNGSIDDRHRDVGRGLAVTLDVARGRLEDVDEIAAALQAWLTT